MMKINLLRCDHCGVEVKKQHARDWWRVWHYYSDVNKEEFEFCSLACVAKFSHLNRRPDTI